MELHQWIISKSGWNHKESGRIAIQSPGAYHLKLSTSAISRGGELIETKQQTRLLANWRFLHSPGWFDELHYLVVLVRHPGDAKRDWRRSRVASCHRFNFDSFFGAGKFISHHRSLEALDFDQGAQGEKDKMDYKNTRTANLEVSITPSINTDDPRTTKLFQNRSIDHRSHGESDQRCRIERNLVNRQIAFDSKHQDAQGREIRLSDLHFAFGTFKSIWKKHLRWSLKRLCRCLFEHVWTWLHPIRSNRKDQQDQILSWRPRSLYAQIGWWDWKRHQISQKCR